MKTGFLAAFLLAAATFVVSSPASAQRAAFPAQPGAATGKFICSDGNLLELEQHGQSGLLLGTRAGESFTLQQQVTRGPPRFVNGADSIVVDGDKLLLRRADNVRLTCERVPAEPVAGVVWGTITKLDRMALPAETRAKVLLVDTARADAPAVEIGSAELRTSGTQVPYWFLIRYDPARTNAPARPQLSARIQNARGKLLYITDTAYLVAEDGSAPASPVELVLVRTGE